MTELKPCPFCGGEAVVDKKPAYGYEPAVSFEVRCSKCGQRRVGGYVDTVYKSEKWARRKAIEVWNERANSWHTGIPTEEGWYLQRIKSKNNITYDTDYYENGDWKHSCIFREIVEWQKIEEKNND